MKFKESNKQKFYMRNVYINQIMKPQIQNNLNYAYFENSGGISDYYNNKSLSLNQKNIFFNNKPIKTLYQNCYPNQVRVNKAKKGTLSQRKNKKENGNNIYENQLDELNEANLFRRNTNNKMSMINNNFNERSFSENRMNNFNKTYTFLKKKEINNNNETSYLRVNPLNKNNKVIGNKNKNMNGNNTIYPNQKNETIYKASNNENISSRNSNSNSSLKSVINSKKSFYDERNKKQNFISGKRAYLSEYNKNKNSINNQNNKAVNENNACTTSPNSNNNSRINENRNNENRNLKYSNNNLSGKNQIKSYKTLGQYITCYKSVDKSQSRNNINCKKNMNNCYCDYHHSPMRQNDDLKNIDNISTLNSPSVPSYSSIIDDNINNSKNYVWIKKNIKNNKLSNNIDKNYLHNYYKKPNINKDNTNYQNIINIANDITNINSYLYNTEIFCPSFINKENKFYENKDLFDRYATIIQSAFRGYIIKRKFDIFYNNYKYYYSKGLEILELILNYFFKKSINIIEEKQKFFNYLIMLKKSKKINKNKNRNKISQKPKSYKNFKMFNPPFSPPTKCRIGINKFYQDMFLHKEIGERFNIIKQNNQEKEMELKYKEKLDLINLKMNKIMKENNILKDINQKNIIKESKFREISKDNKKKDDIINIITNDNKTLARKLKIIQDKFNKLQIQNQDYINYNSENEQFNNKYHEIDLFEEYRNLFLSFLLHKNHEKYYLSVLRKYFYKFRDNAFNTNNLSEIQKKQKLKYIINNTKHKESLHLYQNFMKFNYKGKLHQKDIENRNNILKYKLLNIVKNKEKIYKANLRTYFHRFYYKGIIHKNNERNANIINIRKENYKKICKLLILIEKRKERYYKNLKREYFIKWHLYTKVLALKGLINDKRRKKRQKQKLKKKNENEANNKYLNNNKILHFGKSNIYILNKNKEKELLISLDDKNQNYISKNGNINNVIQATEKLGEIFYKAAQKRKLLDNISEIKDNPKNEINSKDNNDNEDDEDSGDSFGL